MITLTVLTFYLLGVKEEQKRRLEAQNSKYEGMLQEKNERIQQLERQKSPKPHVAQPQQLIYPPSYALSPGLLHQPSANERLL
jgi:hypothetical protein